MALLSPVYELPHYYTPTDDEGKIGKLITAPGSTVFYIAAPVKPNAATALLTKTVSTVTSTNIVITGVFFSSWAGLDDGAGTLVQQRCFMASPAVTGMNATFDLDSNNGKTIGCSRTIVPIADFDVKGDVVGLGPWCIWQITPTAWSAGSISFGCWPAGGFGG